MKQDYQWTIIGAGPAGLATVGKLIDSGVKACDIGWIDPAFQLGDFGCKWSAVPSNTKVSLFINFLEACKSFAFTTLKTKHPLDLLTQDPQQGCPLYMMSHALDVVCRHLKSQVNTHSTQALSLTRNNNGWTLQCEQQKIRSHNVVLAIGAEPKKLNLTTHSIALQDALDPSRLATTLNPQQCVAVFGSSHSAILAIRNLLNCGVNQIINFYQKPLCFALPMNDWVLFDNTGLKGEAADWARQNINTDKHPNLTRYTSTEENIQHHLPQCQTAVYCIGFKRRLLPINGDVRLCDYDNKTGIIAPGLFGMGIAFPQRVIDPLHHQEYSVGLAKFMKYLNTIMPLWLQYPV